MSVHGILALLKPATVICIFVCLVLAPAYLAAANKSEKYDSMRVRVGSWLFGWTIIGWFFALFVSTKK